jgi:hypothetical protein
MLVCKKKKRNTKFKKCCFKNKILKKKAFATPSDKYLGVFQLDATCKWCFSILADVYYLRGNYDHEIDAAKAYDKIAKELSSQKLNFRK